MVPTAEGDNSLRLRVPFSLRWNEQIFGVAPRKRGCLKARSTTFRSLLSWNIDTTAVELVPSVPALFAQFHHNAVQLLASPRAHVVIDDGRRFLDRSTDLYEVIPPPLAEAAASSLLYSKEFYATARARLCPDGVLQQWLPCADCRSWCL
jgi:spermidine synthase